MVGLAALTRADALFLAPILAGALGWKVTSGSPARRVALAATTLAVTAGVLIPWVAYSSIRMESTVLVSTNSGGMLQGANCRSTFYGPLLGAWDPTCGTPRAQSESELVWASEARERALDYALSQPARLPLVASARVLRSWGLWAPVDQARLEAVETRDEGWQIFGWGYHMIVLALAVPGTVILVRRRAELTPVAALAVAVVVTAALSNGNQRFRLALDPVLAVMAATAILAAYRRIRPDAEAVDDGGVAGSPAPTPRGRRRPLTRTTLGPRDAQPWAPPEVSATLFRPAEIHGIIARSSAPTFSIGCFVPGLLERVEVGATRLGLGDPLVGELPEAGSRRGSSSSRPWSRS